MFITFSSLFSFTGRVRPPRLNIPHADKIVHFSFYFGLVFLMALAAYTESKHRNAKDSAFLWGVALFAIVYGIIIEVLQWVFTTTRHGDVWDVLANTMGAIAAMLVVKCLVIKNWTLK